MISKKQIHNIILGLYDFEIDRFYQKKFEHDDSELEENHRGAETHCDWVKSIRKSCRVHISSC
jgi:hypothetical protein